MNHIVPIMVPVIVALLATPAVVPAQSVEDGDLMLSFSTYLGGTGTDDCDDIAVDGAGSVYLACHSSSADFPGGERGVVLPECVPDVDNGGCMDVFVLKLSADGSKLLYTAHFGGSRWEGGLGIAVDVAGNAYVVGQTTSSDFPTTEGAFQTTFAGEYDAFVIKLNPSGAVVYSTYLGGSGTDGGTAIALDNAGSAYVTGSTTSSNFPTTTAAFQTVHGGETDVFVTKLDPSGEVVYSTYLGGSGVDGAPGFMIFHMGITVDDDGHAYVAGGTESIDFPLEQPFQARKNEGAGADAFIAKFNATGTALEYSTYLGGDDQDSVTDIAIDGSRNVYVVGRTQSSDFPTTETATQRAHGGDVDVFVAKLSSSGSDLLFATYLGGQGDDRGSGIAIDDSGHAYIAGVTSSVDFPMRRPAQNTLQGGRDAFVAKLNLIDGTLIYSTYLGGSRGEAAEGLALDSEGRMYVSGFTTSVDFPTVNAIQATFGGGFSNVIVAKFRERHLPTQPRAVDDSLIEHVAIEPVPVSSETVPERVAITVSSEVLADYVGTYELLLYGFDLVLTLEDDRLMGEAPGFGKFQLFAESETDFFSNELNIQWQFVRGDDGIVTHVMVRFDSNEVTAPRKSNDG